MAYRTHSAKRLVRQTRYNLLASIIIAVALIFVTFNWILPFLVNSLGTIKDFTRQNEKPREKSVSETSTLAPPVIFIPYEATNSAKIDITGFATANSKVRIFVDDVKFETDVKSDGTFIAKNITLAIGINSIYGKTVDEKNQDSLDSKTIRLVYDNEKPVLEVTEPQDNQVVKEKKVKVSGKTEKNNQVFINNVQIITNSDGAFLKEQSLEDGENILTIKAADGASNSTEIMRKVTVEP